MLEAYLRGRLKGKKLLLMTHMVLGYPSFDDNWKMLEVMEAVGADVVELQFPFSEPVADGPLFVAANQASLDRGTTVDDCFEFLRRAAQHFSMPLLMMGYYNTVFAMGEENFCRRLASCGGRGAIVPDLPVEYGEAYFKGCKAQQLSPIQILTPNGNAERWSLLAKHSQGFLYCVARKGVTGKNTSFDVELEDYLSQVKALTTLPLALGFGVKSHDDVRALVGRVDMAIIGTAGLQAWLDGGASALEGLLRWDA